MFYYKDRRVTGNGPFLRADIPVGADYEDEQIVITKQRASLTFPLFGGERSVSVRREIGTDKRSKERLYGEVQIFYSFDKDKNAIFICDNQYVYEGEGEKPFWARAPVFCLYRQGGRIQGEQSPSGDFKLEAEVTVQGQSGEYTANGLRQTWREAFCHVLEQAYDSLIQAALEKKIGVGTRLNVPEEYREAKLVVKKGVFPYFYDPVRDKEVGEVELQPVTGWAFNAVTYNPGLYFRNIIDSTWDSPPGGGGWINYYNTYLGFPSTNNHCASMNDGLIAPCPHGSYYGGHIFVQTDTFHQVWNIVKMYYVLDLNPQDHHVVPDPGGNYCMLPICSWHNNKSRYDIVMRTYQQEVVMYLTGFHQ